MPNIATALRDEKKRLSRQQSRTQIDPTKKATAAHRRDIALLKRQVVLLERQVKSLLRRLPSVSAVAQASVPEPKARFGAKGLRSHRDRLGLSAESLGKVLGVSAQSVYNWERGKARPRQDQMAKLSHLRKVGKRQVMAFLAQQASAQGKTATH
jgi:DNA-binding transcriptional regulator YiaG